MIRKVILAFIIAIGSIVLLLVLLLIAYGAYGIHANKKADRAAALLCDRIAIGSDIANAIKLAEKGAEHSRLITYESRYRFVFYGAIFHSSECVADTLDGKVVSVRVEVNDD